MALSTIVGTYRLAADPELKFVGQKSAAKVSLRIVNDKSKKDENEASGWKKVAEHWTTAEAWYEAAEAIAEAAVKGDQIVITGEPVTESWEKDGEKKSRDKINIISYKIYKKNGGNGGGGSSFASASAQSQSSFGGAAEEPPF